MAEARNEFAARMHAKILKEMDTLYAQAKAAGMADALGAVHRAHGALAGLMDVLASPGAATREGEPVGWRPQFDAICHDQERFAIQFCAEIAGRRGERGRCPDPVRLLEMAEALYEAERKDAAPTTEPTAYKRREVSIVEFNQLKATAKRLQLELDVAQEELRKVRGTEPTAKPSDWKQAIDDELATVLSTADSYPTAKEAVKALIDWHVSVALDPRVSSDAQALVDQGRVAITGLTEEEIEAAADSIPGWYDGHDGPSLYQQAAFAQAITRALAEKNGMAVQSLTEEQKEALRWLDRLCVPGMYLDRLGPLQALLRSLGLAVQGGE